jgi:hypothetical protein
MWYTNYNEHRQWIHLSDGYNLVKKTTTTNILYQRVETRSRHNLTFSRIQPTTQDFQTLCLPITPIKDDEESVTSKRQEFHLLEPVQQKHFQTYKIYHIPECDLTSDPIEFTYRLEFDDKHLEILGVVLQNDIVKKILRLKKNTTLTNQRNQQGMHGHVFSSLPFRALIISLSLQLYTSQQRVFYLPFNPYSTDHQHQTTALAQNWR